MSEQTSTPSPRLVARASWMLPLAALLLSIIGNQLMGGGNRTLAIVLGGIGVLLACAGMLAALFSFTGVPKHGPKGIVVPAICGVLLCSIYLGMFMLTLARRQAAVQQAEQAKQANE